MSVYVYESHFGGLYTSDDYIPSDELYCEQCGDSDYEIGQFDTFEEFLRYYADNIYVDPWDGGYDIDLVISDVGYAFDDNLTKEEAANIVRAAKKEMEDK